MINEVVLTSSQREEVIKTIEGKTTCDGCRKDLDKDLDVIRATIGCYSKIKSVIRYVVLCDTCHNMFCNIWSSIRREITNEVDS